jgi:hypothetical protein
MDISLLLNQPGRNWQTVPGAGEGEIQRLASLAPVRLPAELLALLRSSNGGEGELALPPGWFVLDPVEEIIRCLGEPQEREQFPGFVFFGGNGGLERIALDCREGTEPWPVMMIDPIAGPESSERIAPSFHAFVQAIGLPQSDE